MILINIKLFIGVLVDVLLFLYFFNQYEFKYNKTTNFIISYIIMLLEVIVLNCFNTKTSIRLLLAILFYFILVKILYKCKYLGNGILKTVIFVSCSCITEISYMFVLWININMKNNEIIQTDDLVWFVGLIISKLIQLLLLKLIRKIDSVTNWVPNKVQVTVNAAVAMILCAYLFVISKIYNVELVSLPLVVLTLFISIFITMAIIFGYNILIKIYIENVKQKQILEKVQEESKYRIDIYKEKLEKGKELQRMYHDVKNLKIIIDGLKNKSVNTNKADEYIVS